MSTFRVQVTESAQNDTHITVHTSRRIEDYIQAQALPLPNWMEIDSSYPPSNRKHWFRQAASCIISAGTCTRAWYYGSATPQPSINTAIDQYNVLVPTITTAAGQRVWNCAEGVHLRRTGHAKDAPVTALGMGVPRWTYQCGPPNTCSSYCWTRHTPLSHLEPPSPVIHSTH